MHFKRAITRKPGEDFAHGITTAGLGVPNYGRMLEQHQSYIEALQSLGLEVEVLEPLPGYPDAYFVEDAAVVFPEIAIITNPGAKARVDEAAAIKSVLKKFRNIATIKYNGTLDGGDIMQIEKNIYIGLSERTNAEGAAQFGAILEKHGYRWTPVPLPGGLHLKSSVNYIGRDTLMITDDFVDHDLFQAFDKILVDRDEEYAANTLLVNDCLITPKGFPSTRAKLETLGMPVIELDVSEAQKMDGGLSCMSLRF